MTRRQLSDRSQEAYPLGHKSSAMKHRKLANSIKF
jgi:hypothetical protein